MRPETTRRGPASHPRDDHDAGTGSDHHHERILEEIQNRIKMPTISIAMRHGLRLPVPIPNVCCARRDVWESVVVNEEKRSFCKERSAAAGDNVVVEVNDAQIDPGVSFALRRRYVCQL